MAAPEKSSAKLSAPGPTPARSVPANLTGWQCWRSGDTCSGNLVASWHSYLAWTWDAWGSCPNVLIASYAGNPAPFGAAYQSILEALP